ncbi:hypothetical protein BHE18_02850 [Rossellomorea aquimaris]|uniref:Uncharacterized protein n=1 Tax=Rossellomorea aquimaris TaxID=189382 RepID=A0A1J6W5B0_9BACI|nr:hypothetical protein BHE18_02850 [Rossellomorea aquimaris]
MYDVFNEYKEDCDLVEYEGAALNSSMNPGELKNWGTGSEALYWGVLRFDNIIGFLIIKGLFLIIYPDF